MLGMGRQGIQVKQGPNVNGAGILKYRARKKLITMHCRQKNICNVLTNLKQIMFFYLLTRTSLSIRFHNKTEKKVL